MKQTILRTTVAASTCLLALATPGFAQDVPAASGAGVGLEEIIVTARKREESLLEVPAAIQAVGAQELSRSGINGMDALALKVPGFIVQEGGGTVQGGSVQLRGISAADSNPLGETAVSFNFDGVQVARASVRRMGDFDIQQIEILKGPQSLFYGKNSPGGIVSMTSADPKDIFEAGAKVGYEVYAEEFRGEAYVSGPLADGWGARLAAYGSDMRGWVENVLPASDPFKPSDKWGPDTQDVAVRGTLKYDNGGAFRARLKVGYGNVKGASTAANYQLTDCPAGVSGVGVADDCTADDRLTTGVLGSGFAAVLPAQNLGGLLSISDFGDGVPKHEQEQVLSGLELNYDISDALTFASVTGFYDLDLLNRANFSGTAVPRAILGSINALNIQEVSEEVRLTSNLDGRVNFMVGAQYQDSEVETASVAAFGAIPGQPSVIGPVSPLLASSYYLHQKGNAYSTFAQLQIDVLSDLELSVGGRYSWEEKELKSVINRNVQLVGVNPFLSNGKQKKDFEDFSPEVTLTYRPMQDFTVYGSYKEGFLSGGFNGGSFAAAGDLSYKPEYVEGYEAGVKGRLFDDSLTFDLALYDYDITDLQVQVVTQGTVQELRNAGEVSSRGVELGLGWVTPLDGLNLYTNVAYARGKYEKFYGTCYTGQLALSPGTGIGQCASQPNPTNNNAIGVLQNLSGTELIRSPELAGNGGFVYATHFDPLEVEFSSGFTYSDSYITSPTSQPRSRQKSYTLVDASVRVHNAKDTWEVAIIGRNLTDKYYIARGTDNPYGSATPTRLADTFGVVNRGRELMFRVGVKY